MEQKIASLQKLEDEGKGISKLPFSIRILLENALRNHDGFSITDDHVNTLMNWRPQGSDNEVPFKPARVLMQDFTGVPGVVDLASVRAEVERRGKDSSKINPAVPVDLIVDHSVQVDFFGADNAINPQTGGGISYIGLFIVACFNGIKQCGFFVIVRFFTSFFKR